MKDAKWIAIIHKHTAEAFKNESEDVKQEIRALRDQEREEKEALSKTDKSIVSATDEQNPQSYLTYGYSILSFLGSDFSSNYRAQSSLPSVLKNFCEAMSARTGWSFSILAGGPDPATNGTVRTISIHVGQDAYGQSFGRAVPNFAETYLKPFSTFLHSVYREFIWIFNHYWCWLTLKRRVFDKPMYLAPRPKLPKIYSIKTRIKTHQNLLSKNNLHLHRRESKLRS
jgi:hypothetical protein